MPCVNLTGLVLLVLCALCICSQCGEACALRGERLVLSVERGLCSPWREACALRGERLVLVCIFVITHVDCLFAAVNVGSN